MKLYIDQSEDVSATALDARLKRSGLNGKRKKGITIYREVILSEISPLKLDIYTQVEKRGQIRAEQIKDSLDFVVSRAVTRLTPFYGWIHNQIISSPSLKTGIYALKGVI